jgi:sortase A
MTAIRSWLAMFFEYALLGVAIGCFGMYAFESVEARRFQAEQTAAFEEAAKAQVVPTRVRAGGLVGMLDVPRLKLTTPVVEGDDDGILKKAVGHLPDTPMPWENGNAAVAGHRDGLFRPLKDVKVGDEIRFRTTRDEYHYRVTKTAIVEPDDVSVLAPQSKTSLTLITCYPFYYVGSAPQRFIVHAERE